MPRCIKMKNTFMRLNPMPENGKMPRELEGTELIILAAPAKNEVRDIIHPAADISWSRKDVTHFMVLASDSFTLRGQ